MSIKQKFNPLSGKFDFVSEDTYDTEIVGEVFNEQFTNLNNWTSVGGAMAGIATIADNKLSLIGAASLSTNYIRCSGYGNTNAQFTLTKWKQTVEAIGVGTSGKAYGVQGMSLSVPIAIHVNIELSNVDTGRINWYADNNSAVPIQSSEDILPGLVITDIINYELVTYAGNRLVLHAYTSDGRYVTDTLYLGRPRTSLTARNNVVAGQHAFYNRGGNHKISDFTYTILDRYSPDLLIIGDSITPIFLIYFAGRVKEHVIANANPGAKCADINEVEIGYYNAKKVLAYIGTNDIAFDGEPAARIAQANLIVRLATQGVSIAIGNLKIGAPIPRGNIIYQNFRDWLITTYLRENVINFYEVASDGSVNLPSKYSVDAIHPNYLLSLLMMTEVSDFYRFQKGELSNLGLGVKSTNGHLGVSPLNTPFLTDVSANAINATAVATAAQFASGLITSTSAAAVIITTPTGTALGNYMIAQRGNSFELIIDNSTGANTVTLSLGAGITQLIVVPDGGAGSLVVAASRIGIFKIYFSSPTTCFISRIA
jgi:hypothetical protein